MDGWDKLIEAATQTTLARIERAQRLEEHRHRMQTKDSDLTIEQLRDSVDRFDHAAELAEDIDLWPEPEEELDEEPAECLNCGSYGSTVDGIHYICEDCGDEWDI